MNAPALIEQTRAHYLASNIGKARACIFEIARLTRKLDAQANDVAIALTRGTDAVSFAEMTAETVRDLRIAAMDLETFCKLIEDEGASVASRALASRRSETLSHSGKEGL
jgi:hypothetical protein